MKSEGEIAGAMKDPPRKSSVDDPNFDSEVGRRLRIFLDGVEQKDVVAYDCDEGTVRRFKLSADGQPIIDEKRHEVIREVVHGIVTVEWANG